MRWLWIDCITEHEPGKRLVATKQINRDEDHLHQFTQDELTIMPFSLLIEGMAQTAGILVGSTTGFTEKVILAKIAKATLECDVTDGDTVRFDATLNAWTVLVHPLLVQLIVVKRVGMHGNGLEKLNSCSATLTTTWLESNFQNTTSSFQIISR